MNNFKTGSKIGSSAAQDAFKRLPTQTPASPGAATSQIARVLGDPIKGIGLSRGQVVAPQQKRR